MSILHRSIQRRMFGISDADVDALTMIRAGLVPVFSFGENDVSPPCRFPLTMAA